MFSVVGTASKSDGGLCFHYSRMCIVNDMYHGGKNVPTPPALCLGTPLLRQNTISASHL